MFAVVAEPPLFQLVATERQGEAWQFLSSGVRELVFPNLKDSGLMGPKLWAGFEQLSDVEGLATMDTRTVSPVIA